MERARLNRATEPALRPRSLAMPALARQPPQPPLAPAPPRRGQPRDRPAFRLAVALQLRPARTATTCAAPWFPRVLDAPARPRLEPARPAGLQQRRLRFLVPARPPLGTATHRFARARRRLPRYRRRARVTRQFARRWLRRR